MLCHKGTASGTVLTSHPPSANALPLDVVVLPVPGLIVCDEVAGLDIDGDLFVSDVLWDEAKRHFFDFHREGFDLDRFEDIAAKFQNGEIHCFVGASGDRLHRWEPLGAPHRFDFHRLEGAVSVPEEQPDELGHPDRVPAEQLITEEELLTIARDPRIRHVVVVRNNGETLRRSRRKLGSVSWHEATVWHGSSPPRPRRAVSFPLKPTANGPRPAAILSASGTLDKMVQFEPTGQISRASGYLKS